MADKSKEPNLFIKYYDKLLVVVVLIFLLVSLGYLTTVAVTRRQDERLYTGRLDGYRQKSENVKPLPMTAYDAAARLMRTPTRLPLPDPKAASFLSPGRRVSCENPDCGKPIEADAKECPYCGKPQQVKHAEREDLDSDGDGIPDKIEIAWGLNPKDPGDAKEDADKDGFTNLEEYLAKTDWKDPESHPALVNLLCVTALRSKQMPLKLGGINKMPDGYQLVFNQSGPYPQTHYVRVGDAIGKTGYRVVSLDYRVKKMKDKKTGITRREINVSTALLKRLSDNKEVTLTCGEPAKATDVEAVIGDAAGNEVATVLEKGSFTFRGETFLAVSVDEETKTVLVRNEKTGQEKVLKKLD